MKLLKYTFTRKFTDLKFAMLLKNKILDTEQFDHAVIGQMQEYVSPLI